MDDLTMIGCPNNWPLWPVLPLKMRPRNDGSFPKCAVLYEPLGPEAFGQLWFYEDVNPFGMPDPLPAPTKIYESAQEVVDDGWVVD